MNWIAGRWHIISLGVLSAITVLSLIPLPELPAAGGDKLHHLIAYASLVFPIALRRHSSWLVLVLACVVWGGLIELVQPYVNRHGEWLDFAANASGCALGVVLAWLANRLTRQSKSEADR